MKLTKQEIAEILELRGKRISYDNLASIYNVSVTTIRQNLAKALDLGFEAWDTTSRFTVVPRNKVKKQNSCLARSSELCYFILNNTDDFDLHIRAKEILKDIENI